MISLIRFLKILLINILIFITLIFLVEIFFGYWFDKDNLGPYMREHRMKKNLYQLKTDEKNYNYTYKRNYYGFRGEELNLNEIKIILIGGSTADERYKPEEFTIVGLLNKKLRENDINFKIVNAGIEGQSTVGHISNFKFWFPKLKNFSPEYIIFYVGINDSLKNIKNINNYDSSDGWILNPSSSDSFNDNIKSRSIIYDYIRKIKHKYYSGNEAKRIIYDMSYKKKNKKYLNFEEKISFFNVEKILKKNRDRISYYLNNIDKLALLSKELGSIPIFINQEASQENIQEKLLVLNISLIKHCKKKNYNCIDLAKKIRPNKNYWWDGIHTTEYGSNDIANLIFPELKNFLIKK